MELNVQEFLKTHTLSELEEKYGVCARASKYKHKFSLNYDQYLVKENHVIVEECRGLVLAPADGRLVPTDKDQLMNFIPGRTRILGFPFYRFYNAHEEVCAKIDWNDPELRVYEKLDGTLCILYWDDVLNDWSVATRSIPDADLEITNDNITHLNLTFRKLFEKGFQNTTGKPLTDSYELLEPLKGKTLCFELTSPYNRVIVPYGREEITLLMVRDNESGNELDPQDFTFPTAKTFPLATIDDVIAWANTLEAEEGEGAVVTDGNFRRAKIKGINWIMANRVKSSVNTRRDCMDLILQGTIDDFLKYVPDGAKEAVEALRQKTHTYLKKIEDAYGPIAQEVIKKYKVDEQAPRRKAFAAGVFASGLWPQPFFAWWDEKCDFGIKAYIDYLIETKNLKRSTLDALIKLVEDGGNS